MKSIDFKGWGKTGMRTRDFCTFKLIFEEKSQDDFMLELVKGKNPIMIQSLLKEYLKENSADFEKIM